MPYRTPVNWDELRQNWWNMHPPQPVQPNVATRRPCGCHIDPVVFGHERFGVPDHEEAA